MAHYKRGYPRSTSTGLTSVTEFRKKCGLKPYKLPAWNSDERLATRKHWPDEFNMMANWPRWWDVLYHTRPARRKAKAMMLKIRIGRIDPDDTMFPDYRKPLIYYW
jgi:hypothetical protein